MYVYIYMCVYIARTYCSLTSQLQRKALEVRLHELPQLRRISPLDLQLIHQFQKLKSSAAEHPKPPKPCKNHKPIRKPQNPNPAIFTVHLWVRARCLNRPIRRSPACSSSLLWGRASQTFQSPFLKEYSCIKFGVLLTN